MKKITYLLVFFFFATKIQAQAPQTISYQAVVRNSSNALLINTTVGMKISILQGSSTGTAVYTETQTATTNANGLVSIQIGKGNAPTGTFAGIDWSTGSYFIQTETDPTGGSDYTITGTQQMMSVPYALYAAKSGDATSLGTIGASSNANGATLSSGVLSLTPADANNGGLVTTGAQTFAGNKTLTGTLGIGTTAPAASAVLEASSTAQGFLPPRMTFAQRNDIADPATGLVIFCTNCGLNSGELEVYAGGIWRNMMGGLAAAVPVIGQSLGGGIIAYILQPNDPGYDANILHGLIAAPSDQSIDAQWGCGGTVISGADGIALGTGNQNTIDIMNGCVTAGISARICGDLVLNGYSDWYLPSKDELNKLYSNIGKGAPAPNTNIGGFANEMYLSSTEINSYGACSQSFFNGRQTGSNKEDSVYVRAVRSF